MSALSDSSAASRPARGTARDELEHLLSDSLSADLVRTILDSAPDAMIIIDSAGTILFTNRQVSALFGYETREARGKPVEMLLPERFRNRHVQHRTRYTSNVRVRPMGNGLELFALRRDGTEFPVEISLSPISVRGETLIAAAIRDVTEQRRVQIELTQARELAERADRAKSRFLATASHDLRQPVQALALLNGAMRRLVRDPDLAEALTQQEQAIDSMARLLNALLDISKLDSGVIRPVLADFAICDVFRQMQNEFSVLAENKGIRLDILSCSAEAHSDAALVSQILRNLLSNAIKYTRTGVVTLSCHREDAQLRIEVQDTGIGIPDDALGQVFDEFFQVGVQANASRDGYGLGLSIVRRIAELLQLHLSVSSRLSDGSTFAIRLPPALHPSAAAEAGEPSTPGRVSTAESRPHLLLVEDDPGVRNATRMLLKVDGYRVTSVSTLAEACKAARDNPDIALLLTDYHLPEGETGTQVIESVRAILSRPVPVVLITGDTSAAVRDLRRDHTLRMASKPINADELMRLVSALME